MGNAADERAQIVGAAASACASLGLELAQGTAATTNSATPSNAAPSIFEPSARMLDYKYRLIAFMERFVYDFKKKKKKKGKTHQILR